MKTLFLLFALSLFFAACTSEKTQEVSNAVKDTEIIPVTESRTEDVMESLYRELKEQRPELLLLEQEIENADQAKSKSLEDYYKYNTRNEQYYSIAGQHTGTIKDSLLRNSVELLLKKSQYAYDQQNAAMALAAATLENRSTILHDRQEALKIILTMNQIEKYQTPQLPNSTEYKKIIDRYNSTIQTVDSLLHAK